MSKLVLQVIFALCFCVIVGNCAVGIELRNPDAGPNSCISKAYNLNMKAGDKLSVPGRCMQAMCKKNGDISYFSCGMVGVPPGCKLVEADQSLPYPQCCSTQFVCV